MDWPTPETSAPSLPDPGLCGPATLHCQPRNTSGVLARSNLHLETTGDRQHGTGKRGRQLGRAQSKFPGPNTRHGPTSLLGEQGQRGQAKRGQTIRETPPPRPRAIPLTTRARDGTHPIANLDRLHHRGVDGGGRVCSLDHVLDSRVTGITYPPYFILLTKSMKPSSS